MLHKYRVVVEQYMDFDIEARSKEEAIETALEWWSEGDPDVRIEEEG